MSWDAPADSGLLSGKSTALRNTIKRTHCMVRTPYFPQYKVSRHTLFSLPYVCALRHAYSDSFFLCKVMLGVYSRITSFEDAVLFCRSV